MISRIRAREIVTAINQDWDYSLPFRLNRMGSFDERLPFFGDDFSCRVVLVEETKPTAKSANIAKATATPPQRLSAKLMIVVNTQEPLGDIKLRVVTYSRSEHYNRFRGAVTMTLAQNWMNELEECSRYAIAEIEAHADEVLSLKLEMDEEE